MTYLQRTSSIMAAAALALSAAPASSAAAPVVDATAGTDGVPQLRWERIRPDALPDAQPWSAMAYDSDRDRIVLSGLSQYGASGEQETWIWDGNAWTELETAQPPRRAGAAMAYDEARHEVVLVGGLDTYTEHAYRDTWVFDGTTWSERTPEVSPPWSAGASMAYDPLRQEIVTVRGSSSGSGRADTWLWDGAAWQQRETAVSPRSVSGYALAWDQARQAVVLYGGETGRHRDDRSTWAWDGTTWTKVRTRHQPTASKFGSLTYSPWGPVLFGGSTTDTFELDETWVLRDRTWTQVAPDLAPRPRHGAAMAYDSARDEIVLFGGGNRFRSFGDMWLLRH